MELGTISTNDIRAIFNERGDEVSFSEVYDLDGGDSRRWTALELSKTAFPNYVRMSLMLHPDLLPIEVQSAFAYWCADRARAATVAAYSAADVTGPPVDRIDALAPVVDEKTARLCGVAMQAVQNDMVYERPTDTHSRTLLRGCAEYATRAAELSVWVGTGSIPLDGPAGCTAMAARNCRARSAEAIHAKGVPRSVSGALAYSDIEGSYAKNQANEPAWRAAAQAGHEAAGEECETQLERLRYLIAAYVAGELS